MDFFSIQLALTLVCNLPGLRTIPIFKRMIFFLILKFGFKISEKIRKFENNHVDDFPLIE